MTTEQEQSREIFFHGVEHFEAGRLAEARSCFERCRALTPDRLSVLGNLGVTLFRLGQAREALPLLQQATAGEPGFADAWAGLGFAHETLGEWAAAVPALQRALVLVPRERSAALALSLGQCLMRLNRPREALPVLDRAVAADPTLADARSVRGGLLRELRQLDAAAHSYEQALAHGADPELHAYYLASMRRGTGVPPARAPRQYVEGLFDDYAADFAGHLVGQLGYLGHEQLLAPLVASGRRFRHALDLGCGTALCAPLLAPLCETIDGVDLSAAMLAQARQLGLYRALVHADIGEFLAGSTQRVNLMVAADVMIYVGELSGVLRDAARLLEPDGLFAFTVELPTSEGQELQLLPSLRYAHSETYVRRLAADAGLLVDAMRAAPIRHEHGRPVPGLSVTLRAARAWKRRPRTRRRRGRHRAVDSQSPRVARARWSRCTSCGLTTGGGCCCCPCCRRSTCGCCGGA
jgi:predicted TPR repeat methyltransferase